MSVTYINLSGHPSVKLLPNAPWVEGKAKNGRDIKFADLSNKELSEPTIAAYLAVYTQFVLPANDNSVYPNPEVKQLEATSYDEVLEDGTIINHTIGGMTVVEGLPEPQEGVIYITSYPTAQAAKRPDVVSPNTIADPANGFAIGAFGFFAAG